MRQMIPDYIVWRITETEEELRAALDHPELYADKVANLKAGSNRMLEVLAVRRAMKVLFGGEEKLVEYDEHGAPRLADGSQYISISHTRDYVAVIASDAPVGIDIERRGERVQRVTSHFLQHDELALLALSSADDEALQLALHLAWSAKEAAFKVLGQDYYDLQHLTRIAQIDWHSKRIIMEVHNLQQPLTLGFDYTPDYVLVWLEMRH